MLSSTMIAQLKIILSEEYGLMVDDKIAAEIGSALVGYFDLLINASTGDVRTLRSEEEK